MLHICILEIILEYVRENKSTLRTNVGFQLGLTHRRLPNQDLLLLLGKLHAPYAVVE